jgi:hypothetical protein
MFTASSAVLILLPIFFYFHALYNRHVSAWLDSAKFQSESSVYWLAVLAALERIGPLPIPSLSFLSLAAAFLLFCASGLYAIFCPQRIKQFSREQWTEQFERPLIAYWPHSWRFPLVRLVCTALYGLGGVFAIYIIGRKLAETVWYVLT